MYSVVGLGRGIVIEKIGKVRCKKGKKTRVRYPSQMGGYISQTFISKKCAKLHVDNLSSWAKSRAKFYPA